MDLKKRFIHQLYNLEHIFQRIQQSFNQQKPVDLALTRYFRKHPQYGSRDRGFISSSIFGFYRWYGWLRQLGTNKSNLALLLGYLLDGNTIDNLIEYQADKCGLSEEILTGFGKKQRIGVFEKSGIVSSVIPRPDISLLNPEIFGHWPESMIEAFQTRPNLWIRMSEDNQRSFKAFLDSGKIDYRVLPACRDAFEIMSSVNLHQSKDYQRGKLEVQDISSQGVGLICQPEPGEVWWDVCAGSGGKTLHLSSLMKGTGTVYATEISQIRLNSLIKRIRRSKNRRIIKPVLWDGIQLPKFKKPPHAILVDVPCSCSGTCRRNPDVRWHITKEKIERFAKLQFELLVCASAVLQSQGKLIYATCSILPDENEKVVEKFLKSNPDFNTRPITCPFTGKKFTNGCSFLPPDVDGNGMFVASMVKK